MNSASSTTASQARCVSRLFTTRLSRVKRHDTVLSCLHRFVLMSDSASCSLLQCLTHCTRLVSHLRIAERAKADSELSFTPCGLTDSCTCCLRRREKSSALFDMINHLDCLQVIAIYSSIMSWMCTVRRRYMLKGKYIRLLEC